MMSFLSFLSQKTGAGESLRPEIILSRNYLIKCSIWPPHLSSLIFHLTEIPYTLNPLELEANIFRIVMSL